MRWVPIPPINVHSIDLSSYMSSFNLETNKWQLSGWTPDMWRLSQSMELGSVSKPEVACVPCRVPGSAQKALRDAGILPDWNVGLNARLCEWVENRHWMYETRLPEVAAADAARIRFEGLDGHGEVWIDRQKVLDFNNAFLPYEADLTGALGPDRERILRVIFLCSPRFLGQTGYTSRITDWKPRFNYTWDWMPRLVQIGIFGTVTLEVGDTEPLKDIGVFTTFDPTDSAGSVHFRGLEPSVTAVLRDGETEIASMGQQDGDWTWKDLRVERWEPNGNGVAQLYTLELSAGTDKRTMRVGFRDIVWKSCKGAALDADPWLCCVNGRDTFLQGVNWTPIRPNFADLTQADYRLRLEVYRKMGMNCVRIWGGGFAEHLWLYELCDEMGILVWQDFPLSSSGLDNWPPESEGVMDVAISIAEQSIRRLRHHACLFLWCGGNELQGGMDGGKEGIGLPATLGHPLLARFAEAVMKGDPPRRFVATTSSGPRFTAAGADFGKNLHWDVHGPWAVDHVDIKPWQDYWRKDDALFRSEMGNAGAQPADLMETYLGDCDFRHASVENPYWQRVIFWFELGQFLESWGERPWGIQDYVEWSQTRQGDKLAFAIQTYKARFPACGGMILWMGHDAFPCPVNTSLLDFLGRPKPACAKITEALRNVLPPA